MKIAIIAGGTPPSLELLRKTTVDCDYIIAADKGANSLFEYGIIPNVLLGDFDSIDAKVLSYFENSNCRLERYPSEKDATDTEIALNKAIDLGAIELLLFGCIGTRMDHTLGNIGLLLKCLKRGVKAYIIDDHNEISITDKDIKLLGSKNEIFSVGAYCAKVEALTIKGAKYNLLDFDLKLGDGITISNEFLDGAVEISFKSGVLILIRSKD